MIPLISRSSLSPSSIYCVGKNYPDHEREMASMESGGKEPSAVPALREPIIFMKPGSALACDGITSIPLFGGIPISSSMHYEVELVLLVGCDTDGVCMDNAASVIAGYGVGLDMTLRDVQLNAKKAGNPWLKSKGFRRSALVSDFVPSTSIINREKLSISLRLNGRLVQHSPVSEMTFSPEYLVYYLSYVYGLKRDDLIFTGTPAGVGPTKASDRLDASLESGDPSTVLATLEAIVN
jgi:2-keto-4-pentenoate hydratase/2-oxohepta-3-ene-1,7-dioic acid hydratase in catechol pathway